MTIILDDRELDNGNEITPEMLLEAKERGELVRSAVATLEPKLREVVEDVMLNDGTCPRFAETRGIDVRTVYDRLNRGLKKLAVILKGWE